MKTDSEKALARAIEALHFDDGADYQSALFGIVYILGGDEAINLFEDNPDEAYEKYCEENK